MYSERLLERWQVDTGPIRFTGAIAGWLDGKRFSVLAREVIVDALDAYRAETVIPFPDRSVLTFDETGSWRDATMQAEIQLYPEGVCCWIVGTDTLSIRGSETKPPEALRKVIYWHKQRDNLIYRIHQIEKRLKGLDH